MNVFNYIIWKIYTYKIDVEVCFLEFEMWYAFWLTVKDWNYVLLTSLVNKRQTIFKSVSKIIKSCII